MLTRIQSEIAAKMLRMAAEEFGCHGSNDMNLDNTPENLEFVEGMIAAGDYPKDAPTVSRDRRYIYVMDWEVMMYCAKLIEEQGQFVETDSLATDQTLAERKK